MIVYTNKHRIPFIIDDDDYQIVYWYSWYISSDGYPTTNLRDRTKYTGQKPTFLHQLLLGRAPAGFEWDHRNQETLDNRRENLRLVTTVVNQRNVGLSLKNTSGIKGVSLCGPSGSWRVDIQDGKGKQVYVGRYPTLEQAAKARQEAELKYWGDER